MQDFGLDFRLALLGFGNAGQAFAALLEEKRDEIRATYGRNVIITAIVTGSRGSIVNPEGIDTAEARRMLSEDGVFSPDFPGYCDNNRLRYTRNARQENSNSKNICTPFSASRISKPSGNTDNT